jgi:hypothetical protein
MDVAGNDAFCTNCGMSVANRKCAGCGESVSEGDAFCTKCGTPVNDANQAVASPAAPLYTNASDPLIYSDPPQYVAPPPPPVIYPVARDRIEKKPIPVAAIIAIIALGAALLGYGLYMLLGSENDSDPESPPQVQSDESDESEASIPAQPTMDSGFRPIEVFSIEIVFEGIAISDISLSIIDNIPLYAVINPHGVHADIVWTSSNTDVFIISGVSSDGLEAVITSIAPGSAILTVTADGFTQTCMVHVTENIIQLPLHKQLGNAILETNEYILLFIMWIGGDYDGISTVFSREAESDIWMMISRTGDYREVFPAFSYEGNTFVIKFPRTTTSMYYIYDDGTGYYINPDGSDREDFTWEYWAFP